MTESHCSGVLICLVGPNRFQNKLFTSALKKNHDCKCTYVVATELTDVQKVVRSNLEQKIVVYLDCFGLKKQEIELLVCEAQLNVLPSTQLALFNLNGNTGIESTALGYGVTGFFCQDNTPIDFCRGTQAILKGEIWLPREAISKILFKYLPAASQDNYTVNISNREKEVLTLLRTGASSKSIAADLFVSVHTVRTHLYHIYKKLNVANRAQAILWAEKNLD